MAKNLPHFRRHSQETETRNKFFFIAD